ncbi:hypothetical protein GJ496_006060 [Pomphorhynchus laevis]|nr:hypothetical protein GJ496_006060 [Pomphorhynchus laevis]
MDKQQEGCDLLLVPRSLASTMSIASGPFLAKVLEVMQTRPNWQSYLLGLMISQIDYDFITAFENADNVGRSEMLNSPEQQLQFAKTFLNLLTTISKEQTIQYIMTLLDYSLIEDKRRVNYLRLYTDNQNIELISIFLQMLTRSDSFIIHQASRIISKICCWADELIPERDIEFYFVWLKNQIVMERAEKQLYLQTACRCLQMILRIEKYRLLFVQLNGLNCMTSLLLDTTISFQIQYQLCFCIWLMTFTRKLADLVSTKGILPRLVDILFIASKDKVIRIILMLIRNLLEQPTSSFIIKENSRILLSCKFYKNLPAIEDRKIDDDELKDDIAVLKEKLELGLEELTSFEEYQLELKSHCLSWSPVHKSEKFWKENVERLNDNNLELLKTLIYLVNTSQEPLTISVALHDIGQYVRFYHLGRMIIEKLQIKSTVMTLLDHVDPGVRYQALLCLQKLMIENTEFLGRQITTKLTEKLTSF